MSYAGHTFRFTVDNGTVFHNTYSTDGSSLRYEIVVGPGVGTVEDVSLHVAEVAAGIFMLGWTEKSGMTITHAMNLERSTIHAFWTFPTENGPVGEMHTGTIERIDSELVTS